MSKVKVRSCVFKASSRPNSIIDSIKSAAKTVANGVLTNYTGNQAGETPGIFNSPYYWWSAGQVWDSLIDYWFLTGDESHNNILSQALSFQVGPNLDYMPPNQTKVLVSYTKSELYCTADISDREMMIKAHGPSLL